MSTLLHTSVFLHVLAACIWVGGSIFLVLAFVPYLRHPELGPSARTLFGPAARRFRNIGWICLVLLLVIVAGSLFHDLVAGPRAIAAREQDPEGVAYRKWRATASWIGRVNLLLSLVIVWLGVGLFH